MAAFIIRFIALCQLKILLEFWWCQLEMSVLTLPNGFTEASRKLGEQKNVTFQVPSKL
jgi:hypothetical protein